MDSKIAIIPALDSHALVQFSPLTCEWDCDLLLTERVQQRWHDVTCLLHKMATPILLADCLSRTGLVRQVAMSGAHVDKKQRASSGQQPAEN